MAGIEGLDRREIVRVGTVAQSRVAQLAPDCVGDEKLLRESRLWRHDVFCGRRLVGGAGQAGDNFRLLHLERRQGGRIVGDVDDGRGRLRIAGRQPHSQQCRN